MSTGTTSHLRSIGSSDLHTPPLTLGGNVFGWTADEPATDAVLDAFVDAGGTLGRHRRLLLGLGARPRGGRVRGGDRALAGPSRPA